jgi:hypothetical protein
MKPETAGLLVLGDCLAAVFCGAAILMTGWTAAGKLAAVGLLLFLWTAGVAVVAQRST